MSYRGIIDFKETKIPCYEIFNNKVDFNRNDVLW